MTNEEAPSPDGAEREVLQADRRGAERFPCALQPFWHLAGEGEAAAAPARVQDVSATGIGLRVREAVKPGTVLVINLQTRDRRLSRPLPVRVMHANRQEDGDWVMGCRFVRPLSPLEVRSLLDEEHGKP